MQVSSFGLSLFSAQKVSQKNSTYVSLYNGSPVASSKRWNIKVKQAEGPLFFKRILKNCILGGGIQGPLGSAATNRPIVPVPGDYDDGEIGGMIGKGNRSTRRKPAPVRTRAAAVGSQQLTAWATARPLQKDLTLVLLFFDSLNIYQ
jgi:hypothetical protein